MSPPPKMCLYFRCNQGPDSYRKATKFSVPGGGESALQMRVPNWRAWRAAALASASLARRVPPLREDNELCLVPSLQKYVLSRNGSRGGGEEAWAMSLNRSGLQSPPGLLIKPEAKAGLVCGSLWFPGRKIPGLEGVCALLSRQFHPAAPLGSPEAQAVPIPGQARPGGESRAWGADSQTRSAGRPQPRPPRRPRQRRVASRCRCSPAGRAGSHAGPGPPVCFPGGFADPPGSREGRFPHCPLT